MAVLNLDSLNNGEASSEDDPRVNESKIIELKSRKKICKTKMLKW